MSKEKWGFYLNKENEKEGRGEREREREGEKGEGIYVVTYSREVFIVPRRGDRIKHTRLWRKFKYLTLSVFHLFIYLYLFIFIYIYKFICNK